MAHAGAARPMMPAWPARGSRPALRARNARLLSLLASALASPAGIAVAAADPAALAVRLERFRSAFRRAQGPSPLDDLWLSVVVPTGEAGAPAELWIAHRTILVPLPSPVDAQQAQAQAQAPEPLDLMSL